MDKRIWREVFSASQSIDYKMLHYHPKHFVEYAALSGASTALKDIVIIFENGIAKRYEPIDQLEKFLSEVFENVIQQPQWAIGLHEQCELYGQSLFERGEDVQNINLENCTDEQLIDLNNEIVDLQIKTHMVSNALARVDAYDQRFSTYMIDRIQKESGKNSAESSELFSLLTTPHRLSFEQKQTLELNMTSDKVSIDEHARKWAWLGYGYGGPAYTKEFFVEELKKIDPEEISQIKMWTEKVTQKQKELAQQYYFDNSTLELLEFARSLIWTKDFRKHCMFYACYILDLVHTECAKRLGMNLENINFITPQELDGALQKGIFEKKISEQRRECSVLAYERGENNIYSGDEAYAYIKKMIFEKEEEGNELKGQCAYAGLVEGKIKIIESVNDINDIDEYTIIAVHTTFPSYVPVITKCAGLLSESGGITCHAAIVAREFKKPTIVGIKHLLKYIKDGDLVRVDASRGSIEILT